MLPQFPHRLDFRFLYSNGLYIIHYGRRRFAFTIWYRSHCFTIQVANASMQHADRASASIQTRISARGKGSFRSRA